MALWLLMVVLLAPPPARPGPVAADPPATRPAAPATLAGQVAALGSADADVRDAAREHLMGLDAASLTELADAAAKARPLTAQHRAALRDVVMYLAVRRQVTRDAARGGFNIGGFLGVSLPPATRRDFGNFDPQPAADGGGEGVMIYRRVPGQVAWRHLRDGDLIVGITGPRGPQAIGGPDDLIGAVGLLDAGEPVVLDVVRDGVRREIALTLDRRPVPPEIGFGGPEHDELTRLGEAQGEQVWREQFEPLFARRPDGPADETEAAEGGETAELGENPS